ncbi:Homeodomain-like superfamily protein [Abeliophyllum distichum]|uniref:Homeodomain-like superfamily protein n=1 Tax=Abeliophyllum distichum TaxID=126358 RepID=A0ABD1TXJ0_9LAMI
MADKTKKRKTGSISEEDVSTLLQRYSAQTVLALLQEVAQVPEKKIDWNAMVKNTTTGISNPREYQMLWRHLAYRDDLVDSLSDAADPLDEDSDLEFELEAFPAVSRETSSEAAACVKVLIASGTPNDSHLPNNSTIEAPLTINIPNREKSTAPSESSHLASCMQGTNITIPVSVQKQQLATVTCAEKKRSNGSTGSNLPPRRKRKPWSAEEDMELIAAVQKCGERNWANILKGDFKGDRKPSELSQRWATIRKKQGNLNVGTSSQLSETQLAAAHRAMSLALDMPLGDNLKAAISTCLATALSRKLDRHLGGKLVASLVKQSGTASNSTVGNSTHPAFAETSSIGIPSSKRPSSNPTQTPGSMVEAAAVAAGARVVKPSVASSQIEAARSQNAVRTIAGGGSMIKSLATGLSNQLPSNVHFIRNGLAKAPIINHSPTMMNTSKPGEARQAQVPTAGLARTVAEVTVSNSENVMQENVQKDKAALSGDAPKEEIREAQVALVGNQSEEKVEENQGSFLGNASKENIQANGASVPSRAPIGPTKDD